MVLKRLGCAALLLALAFPAVVGPALAVVVAVAAFLLGHLVAACTTAAALLLFSLFRRPARSADVRLSRGLLRRLSRDF